jgi:DNA-directed RNA polymerase specialized sigma24 family protein
MPDPRELLEAVYRAERERLVHTLAKLFPSLGIDQCEDLVQYAFVQELSRIQQTTGDSPTNWFAWLRTVTINDARDFLKRRERISLDALAGPPATGGDSDQPGWQPSDRALTPSAVLQQGEQAERRRVLVSDILAAYVQHVERYGMYVQREVFERSLRGQPPGNVASEMRLSAQRVYEHRSKAFGWIQAEVQRRDERGSILATVFGDRPASAEAASIHPRRLHDLIFQAVDQQGALCPSDQRLEEYRSACTSGSLTDTDCLQAEGLADIDYHITQSQWYLDDRQQTPGCRRCQDRLENPHASAFVASTNNTA